MRSGSIIACILVAACGAAEPAGGETSSGGAGTSTGVATSSSTTTTSAEVTTSGAATSSGDAESSSDDGPPPTCDVAMPLAAGDYERMLEHDGVMRRYLLHVSPSTEIAAPLVVNMHGYLSGPEMQVGWSLMNEAADPRGVITAHPEGLNNSWNAGTCCGDSAANGVDDVGFIRAVVADIESAVCVDPRRVYATGMSNGGYMSHRLACEAADVFAAVAPVCGALGIPDCTPPRPIPLLAFLGVQDPLVPYAEGTATIQEWITIDGCPADPTTEDFDGGKRETWSTCTDNGIVDLYTLDPMGHCWPGGDPGFCFGVLGAYSDAVDATATMLDFFEGHRLPS